MQSAEMLNNARKISEQKVYTASDEAMTGNLCRELDLVFEGRRDRRK